MGESPWKFIPIGKKTMGKPMEVYFPQKKKPWAKAHGSLFPAEKKAMGESPWKFISRKAK